MATRRKRLYFSCGHDNFGTLDKPASVHEPFGEYNCEVCSIYYCNLCNYETHRCGYCGDETGHVAADDICPSYVADNPEEFPELFNVNMKKEISNDQD